MLLLAAATGLLRTGLTRFIVDVFVNDEIRFLKTRFETVKSYSPKNCRFLPNLMV